MLYASKHRTTNNFYMHHNLRTLPYRDIVHTTKKKDWCSNIILHLKCLVIELMLLTLAHITENITEGSPAKFPTRICSFGSFGQLTQQGKISSILQKYPNFEGRFLKYFLWAKQMKIVHCSARTAVNDNQYHRKICPRSNKFTLTQAQRSVLSSWPFTIYVT